MAATTLDRPPTSLFNVASSVTSSTALQYLVNVLLAFAFIFPIVFMVMSSFKTNDAIFADLRSFRAFLPVGDLSMDNYAGVFTKNKFPRFLFNSIVVSVITTGLGLLVTSPAAYALSLLPCKRPYLVLAVSDA